MNKSHEPGCALNDPDSSWEDMCTCGGEPLKCWDCGKAPCDCCEECEHPRSSKAHLQHCPEAIRG